MIIQVTQNMIQMVQIMQMLSTLYVKQTMVKTIRPTNTNDDTNNDKKQ